MFCEQIFYLIYPRALFPTGYEGQTCSPEWGCMNIQMKCESNKGMHKPPHEWLVSKAKVFAQIPELRYFEKWTSGRGAAVWPHFTQISIPLLVVGGKEKFFSANDECPVKAKHASGKQDPGKNIFLAHTDPFHFSAQGAESLLFVVVLCFFLGLALGQCCNAVPKALHCWTVMPQGLQRC